MARIIDNNPTPFHSTGGTKMADVIYTNGLGHAFGGDGNDILNLAIPHLSVLMGDDYLLAYGGVGRFDVDGKRTIHPIEVTDHGKIGGLNHDGRDTIHYGIGYKVDGGSDADTYVLHAKATGAGLRPWISAFNPREGDGLIFDNSDKSRGELSDGKASNGFDLLGSKFDWVDDDTIILREVTIRGYSTNPIVDVQVTRITFDGEPGDWDGPRGHVSGKIMLDVTGMSQNDDIERWLVDHSGKDVAHVPIGDHFDQFVF